MGVYSTTKSVFDKATFPLVLGGWLLVPFFGATANIAHAANPDAGIIDSLGAFYGPVLADPVGSVTTGLGHFTTDLAVASTNIGSTALSTMGVNMTAGGLTTAFSFATGAAVIAAGLYGAYVASNAIFTPKASPA